MVFGGASRVLMVNQAEGGELAASGVEQRPPREKMQTLQKVPERSNQLSEAMTVRSTTCGYANSRSLMGEISSRSILCAVF